MSAGKPPKKSDMLEVRLPHETKVAFMARCRETRRTASEAVQVFIDQELDGRGGQAPSVQPGLARPGRRPGRPGRRRGRRPLAGPADRSHAAFDRLDANHDGVLSREEFSGR